MKRKWAGMLKYLVGLALVAAVLVLLFLPDEKEIMVQGGLRLSHESGFYDEPFNLEIISDGGEIHYTMDCSRPDENSPLYTGPILIEDASANENVFSVLDDVCLELHEALLASVGKAPVYGFKTPTKPIDKATVIRAVCIDGMGVRSEVLNAVYFVGYNDKTAYDGFNIITIFTEPENLFDYEDGIYVLGKGFGDTLVDGELVESVDNNLGNWPANYKNKGLEWERPAEICFFDGERNLLQQSTYGIRIQGGASRYMLPKSLNLFARDRYGSIPFPTQAIFGQDWKLHSLNLNAGGQGSRVMLHDCLVNRLCEGMDFLTREYVPCALFLDGEFWGVYWLTPRFKEDYFESKYGIVGTDVIETKTDGVEVGANDDIRGYKSLLRLIGDGDMSDPDTYAQLCEQTDIDSWIDYYAVEMYIANTDWPKNNRSMWRTRKTSEGVPMADGRWRWVMFDVNLSMDLKHASEDPIQFTESKDPIFSDLMENQDFEAAICKKLVELAQDTLSPDRVGAFIENYKAGMADAMENVYDRFYDGERTRQDFIDACDAINDFFKRRHDCVMEAYGEKQK